MKRIGSIRISAISLGLVAGTAIPGAVSAQEGGAYTGLVSRHAAAHGLPPSLVHRVIMRESRYNPRAVSKGNYGMMQIRLGTARAMGYRGNAAGLLDPHVNMTYAVKYLAGAYRAAGGNHDRAVALYARGYHDVARRRGTSAVALAEARAPAAMPLPGMMGPPLSYEARNAYNAAYMPRRGARFGVNPVYRATTPSNIDLH